MACILSMVAFISFAGIRGQEVGRSDEKVAQAASAASATIYLPLVTRNFPLQTIFGVEMSSISASQGLERVAQAGTTWVRRAALEWKAVEAIQGVRDWGAVAGLKQEVQRAGANNLQVILVVRGAPSWAAPRACGPIEADKLAALADFMREAVGQFPTVRYWELWNEPDIDYALLSDPNSLWGCWGDGGDAAGYGGSGYAAMLQAVYPAVKAANPQAQVVAGALLLDCDPADPPPGKDCTPAKFLAGVLQAGGGAYLDGVSFHAYDYYWGQLGEYGSAFSAGSRWDTTGPVTVAKARFVKGVLAQYGVSGKFLMNTEAALLTGDNAACDSVCEMTKAFYVAQAYTSALAEGLWANIWYSVLGWPGRNTALLDSSLNPLPAYTAYQTAAAILRNAVFQSEIAGYHGIRGYKFNRGDRNIWVLWSSDAVLHTVSLTPGTPHALFDALGTPQSVTGSTLDVTQKPLYVEW